MKTISARAVQRALATLDPAARPYPAADEAQRAALLRAVVSTPRVERRPSAPRRRTLVLAAAATAVAGIVGAGVVVDAVRTGGTAASAATPPMLVYDRPAHSVDPADLLRRIAGAAERTSATGFGDYEYIQTTQWKLLHPEFADRRRWTVEKSEYQVWYRLSDCSGRSIIHFFVDGERPPDGAVDYGPGELSAPRACEPVTPGGPAVPNPLPPPTNEAGVREQILPPYGYRGSTSGRATAFGRIAFFAERRVLLPATRAALWRFLAAMPGVQYTGHVTDRAGRRGEAFSLDGDGGYGPVRETLIVDPATGHILGFERILMSITNPSYNDHIVPLRIPTPAVVGYVVILSSEHRATMN